MANCPAHGKPKRSLRHLHQLQNTVEGPGGTSRTKDPNKKDAFEEEDPNVHLSENKSTISSGWRSSHTFDRAIKK